jgi:hypothetical protein
MARSAEVRFGLWLMLVLVSVPISVALFVFSPYE